MQISSLEFINKTKKWNSIFTILHSLQDITIFVLKIGSLLKGSVQRILRGVTTKLKYSVLVNWRPGHFYF
jgi:hypothetical protein